jgi:hypothetical protein
VSRTQATQDPVVVSQTPPPPQAVPARQVATHWWRVRSQVAVGAEQSSLVTHSTQAPLAGSQTLPPGQAAVVEQAAQRPVARSQRGVEPAHASSLRQDVAARPSAEESAAPPASVPVFPPFPPPVPALPSIVPAFPPVSPRTMLVVEDESLPQPAINPTVHPRISQAVRAPRSFKVFPHPQNAQKQTRS